MTWAGIDIWQFVGGIGLFLFAMAQLESGLRSVAGRTFKQFLRRYTGNAIKSVVVGTVSTAILQSSSLVGLLVLAFVGASVMSLQNALGVIFGANLGTTLTGWVVATLGFKLDLDSIALPLVGIGSLLFVGLRGRASAIGRLLAAVGFLLMGISLMKDSVGQLSQAFDVTRLADLPRWQYLVFGVVFAAIVQSSSAVMLVTLAALHSAIIELPAAAAIAVGADLGTTSTVLLGAVKGAASKKRVALAHVIFNATTAVLGFIFLLPLLAVVAAAGVEDPLFSLVAFHSLFNFLGITVFLPIVRPFADFLQERFTGTVRSEGVFVSQTDPAVAEAALVAVAEETAHIVGRVIALNLTAPTPALRMPLKRLPVNMPAGADGKPAYSRDERYRIIKRLEGEILSFSLHIQNEQLDLQQSATLATLLAAVRHSVRSAKALRDVQHNLDEFADSPKAALNAYASHYREIQQEFYEDVFALRPDPQSAPIGQDFDRLIEHTTRLHDRLDAKLYPDIHRHRLVNGEISSVLNVNREVRNSNESLSNSLKAFYSAVEAQSGAV